MNAPTSPAFTPSMTASGSSLLSISSSASAESYVNLVAAFLVETNGSRNSSRTWSMNINATNVGTSYLAVFGM